MTTSKYFKDTSHRTTRNMLAANESEEEMAEKLPSESSGDKRITLESVFAEITKVSTKLTNVGSDVASIKNAVATLHEAVNGLQDRMGEAEGRISQMEDKTGVLKTSSDKMGKKLDTLWDRVQALENQNKRNNVRLVGLKETYGTDGTLDMCVKKILREGLGINTEAEFEIERLHRALAPMPNEGQPPRAVLIRFLRQSAREKVLRAAAVKQGISWEGHKLSIFPDVTKELAEKRKSFLSAKMALRRHNVRYTLAFPAMLRFTWMGKNQRFTHAEEAERFINRHFSNE